MNIRAAGLNDAAAIARVHIESWRQTYVSLLPAEYLSGLSYERREEHWRNRLADSQSREVTYVAEIRPGEVGGFVSGGPERSGSQEYTAELYAIYILSACQRRGIGTALTAALARRLADDGHSSLLVRVLAGNPSRGFYEALGGIAVSMREIDIGGNSLLEVAYGWKDIGRLAELP